MANIVIDVLDTYGVSNCLMAVTADNASNNDALQRHISKCLYEKCYAWDYEANTVNCITHVIQLGINALLSKLKVQAHNEKVDVKLDDAMLKKIRTECSFSNTV